MADVTRSVGDRGQLIIITGLVIAVALVALTLLLNTAIYTENLASRGTSVDGANAINFLQASDETVGGLMEIENDREHGSHDDVAGNVRDGIRAFDQTQTEQYSQVGTSARITNITFHNGTRVRQTSSVTFTNSSGETDWTLVTGTSDLRMFEMRYTSANVTTDPEDGGFRVTISGGSTDWNLFVYDNGGPTLAVSNDSVSDPVEVCDSGGSFPVEVNLTAGTVNGESCSDLHFTKSVDSPYTVSFTRGDDADGTYNLTVNGTSAVESQSFNSIGGGSPYEYPVVYSTHFDVEYRTEDVYYRANVRVARGEPV